MNDKISESQKTLVFFYGTLKKGQSRASILDGQEMIGQAVTKPNYRMYNCGTFPALKREDNGNRIQGELWLVDQKCKTYLDYIEGAPNFYCLEKIELESVSLIAEYPEPKEAYSYLFQHDASHLPDCGVCWK